MTFAAFEEKIADALCAAGIENSRTEAANLLSEILDLSNSELAFKKATGGVLTDGEISKLNAALERRVRREPLQYITGRAYFRDLILEVDGSVLIPRFETEILVDHIVKKAPRGASLLDIGTGSGAIAVSCAFERKDLEVLAVDVSTAALETARRNAAKYAVENLKFQESDLFSAVEEGRQFDVIAANLPYVTFDEYAGLQQEVRGFEPELALTAPQDGLELIFKVCRQLDSRLKKGGFAIFEMSPHQTERVAELLRKSGFAVSIISDYTSRERFVCAEKE
jgi:release factor glutamine methyltransferase